MVLQGGGARGIFIAGVTDAILETGISFPYVIGTSAGALIGFNIVSKDIGRAKKVIIQGMADKRFASFKNYRKTRSYFDFNYLFHVVPKESIPFNYEEYENSDMTFYCGCTCLEDGAPAYFEKSHPEFFSAAAASSTLPFMGDPVKVGDRHYMDGCTVCPIPFRKALEDGVEKMVVVFSRDRSYRKGRRGFFSKLGFKLKYRKYPNYLKGSLEANELYNRDMDELFELEKQGKAFLIMPRTAPTVGRSEKDPEKLEELYREGYSVGKEELPKLKAFLGEGNDE